MDFFLVSIGSLCKCTEDVSAQSTRPTYDVFRSFTWIKLVLSKDSATAVSFRVNALRDDDGKPKHWPMRLAKVHWAHLLEGLPPGEYTLRSRTVDEKGHGQPLPRPFRKSGHAAIETVTIKVA